ncbi:hypothetical protein FB639_000124 [Coemansia asiatica]|nr:hypothetical protein FB639_000124 [Coemansia asiatica]
MTNLPVPDSLSLQLRTSEEQATEELKHNEQNGELKNIEQTSSDTAGQVQDISEPKPLLRRTSTASSSKLHDVIQDIISQFDPLKTGSASTTQQQAPAPASSSSSSAAPTQPDTQINKQGYPDMRANFEPEPDGFNYSEFLQQMRHPAAKPVARTVKSFLTEFGRRPMTLGEQVRFVHDFLDFIGGKMRECPVWSTMDERSLDNAREGMEKLVMNRLFPLCFSPTTSDDTDKDHVLREKMNLFRWIQEEHLDVPKSPQNSAFLQFAREELLKINNFNSPRDKVICILNCCTIIYGLLKNMRGLQTADVGADRFLPLLIYVVITACPPKLVSNVMYITRFRSPERLQSEAGYYVTNLQGAIAFIESMDASCLSISQEVFDKNIEMTIWEMELERRTRERNLAQQQQQQQQQQQRTGHVRTASAAQQDMSGERAQWLIDRSSDLAKTTLEKTNNFVGRLISEFSSPSASESGRSSPQVAREQPTGPRVRYPGEQPTGSANPAGSSAVDSSDVAADLAAADSQLLVGGPEWVATLALVRDMFPNIDRDVVDIIFEANSGVVARTIEQLLDISSDNEVLATAAVMAEKSRDESEELIREILLADAKDAAEANDEDKADGEAEAESESEAKGKSKAKTMAYNEAEAIGDSSSRQMTASARKTTEQNEDAAEEMEKWKGRWADDSDDSDLESELDENPGPSTTTKPVSAAAVAQSTTSNSSLSAGLETQKSEQEETPLAPETSLPTDVAAVSVAGQPQQAVPDTSGDEEYARRLQEEFERQAHIDQ